ncbi:hypothetical protein DL95DRAFT_525686 [Leptodontidium sp. 2 PMI_412]|nr:hypothetical protein DL95DRAFT_525686 [Leptodontidium sp. 2 PMI_412]
MADLASQNLRQSQDSQASCNKETILKMLQEISQRDLQLSTFACFAAGYLLDKYHDTVGDPIQLPQSFLLQPYPIGPGSLQLQSGHKGSADNLLYRITLRTADEHEEFLQGLLVGRLMKNHMATHYVIFLASDHRIYACLSSAVDKYEMGPYRDYDEDYDEDDWEDSYEVEEDIYMDDKEVFGGNVTMVDFGTLSDLINSNGNCKYTIMDNITSWVCFGYAEGKNDPTFNNDAVLAKLSRSSSLA